jgi:hypothetical protein
MKSASGKPDLNVVKAKTGLSSAAAAQVLQLKLCIFFLITNLFNSRKTLDRLLKVKADAEANHSNEAPTVPSTTVATVSTAITTPSAVTAAMQTAAPQKTNKGQVKKGKTANDGGDEDDSSGANVKSVSKKCELAGMKAGEDDVVTDHDDKAIKEEIDK